MNRLNRRSIGLGIALIAVLLLGSLFLAPAGNSLQSGSTYGKSPDGYGAWYASVEAKGAKIQRWQKPIAQFLQEDSGSGRVLLQVSNGVTGLLSDVPNPRSPGRSSSSLPNPIPWVERGNVLVVLGVESRVTQAPFSSFIPHETGAVQVETARRSSVPGILADNFGSVVWQEPIGNGRIIYASTPFLAANAYQNASGNFALLTKLVTEAGYPIWVDEYLHGYRDRDVLQQEARGDVFSYLMKTPLLLLAIQAGVILLVLVWGLNRRLGPAIVPKAVAVDNSEAYIQAMAQVLRKAECSEFVVKTVGEAELQQIQRSLGLGNVPLPPDQLVAAWKQQTQQPDDALKAVVQPLQRKRRLREPDLLSWLQQIQTLRRQLPFHPSGVPRP